MSSTTPSAPDPMADGDETPTPVKASKPVVAKKKVIKKTVKRSGGFFSTDVVNVDVVNEAVEKTRLRKLIRVVQMQAIVIIIMAAFFVFTQPLFQTEYQYFAVDSNKRAVRMVHLTMPNMTNQAVISWATNSITEIMTFGFGDYIPHLRQQQMRFTPKGWTAFVAAFDKMQLGKTFKERQLVLTTVPSDSAVILSQGPNLEHIYQWKVQMPVVMTYATNDNITHRDNAIIELVITRVATADNPTGIAIKNWTLGQ